MAKCPCNQPASLCDQQPNPLTSYSAEAVDGPTFIGDGYAPNLPLLNKVFTVYPCEAQTESQVSQEDANLSASRAAAACANPCSPLFFNVSQTASKNCPDGTAYFFTVDAGTFSALSQLLADRQALSYASEKLDSHSLCLANLAQTSMCQGSFYSSEIVVAGADSPFTFSLISGTLPPGISMVMESGSVFFSGTPTQVGVFTFGIKAVSALGVYTTKTFQMFSTSITTPSKLADAFGQTPYSQTLGIYNPTNLPVSWAVTSGQLPPGLTLNQNTGVISGTITAGGLFAFTVGAAIDDVICFATFTINAFIIDWRQLAWSNILNHPGAGSASSSFSGGTFSVSAQGSGGGPGYVEASGSMTYVGPTVNCKVVVTVTAGGSNAVGFSILQDGIGKLALTEANIGAPGVYTFNFTIASTALSTITIIGRTDIGDPARLFVYSFNNVLGAYSAVISQA